MVLHQNSIVEKYWYSGIIEKYTTIKISYIF